ncbi:MAG: hypothetical protein QM582_00875, partial [Micropruina sp.]|uniref:ATP-binding protein n=1 Tax=Micropruina sp. TaxID=2737536 RepID=UPI0039E4C99F
MIDHDPDGSGGSTFLGRDGELADLLAALRSPYARLITVTGIPGIGKTRLAMEVSARLADELPSRFVPLAGLSDAADIPAAVAAAQPVDRASGPPGRPVLLVLDNAEHLTGAAEQVRRLLDEHPRVLVTSVRPLGLAVERTLRLGPLGAAAPPGESRRDAAVRLFDERATAGSVAYHPADPDSVAALCELLGRIPLAIELAAAQAGIVAVPTLLEQLRHGAGLDLRKPSSDTTTPDRHRSMRHALTWSSRLLEPGVRRLFAALSVFAGPITVDGAVAVSSGLDVGDVFDGLPVLVDVHLLEPVAGSGPARFRLLPPVRQFAHQALLGTGALEQVERAHTQHVLELGARAASAFARGDHAAAFGLLEQDWVELAATTARLLEQARAGGPDQPVGPVVEAGLALAVDCAPYLLSVGHDEGAQVRLERLIELGRSTGADEGLLTRALLWSAVLGRRGNDRRFGPDWVRSRMAEGIARARTADDADALLLGLELTALATTRTGDVETATAAVEEALARPELDEGRRARFEALAGMLANQRGELVAAG